MVDCSHVDQLSAAISARLLGLGFFQLRATGSGSGSDSFGDRRRTRPSRTACAISSSSVAVTFATDKRRRAFTPFARATVFSKLVELAHGAQEAATPVAGTGVAASAGNGATAAPDSSGTASSGGGAPNAPQRPQDWDEIGIGSLVLAHEGPEDGWWESIVIGVNGESLSLKWRDWPRYPVFVRRRTDLALLPAAAK